MPTPEDLTLSPDEIRGALDTMFGIPDDASVKIIHNDEEIDLNEVEFQAKWTEDRDDVEDGDEDDD